MTFASSVFVFFLLLTLALWWWLPFPAAKRFLILANLFFYGYWYPPYALILIAIGSINYWSSKRIASSKKKSREWLLLALGLSLATLAYFKYANFLLGNIEGLVSLVSSVREDSILINVILPLGISFYTFQAMSYVIDVYRRKIEAAESFVEFFLYLSFFPQLVAGPIVRASDFIQQLLKRQTLSIEDWQFAIYRITRGFFLKLIIADNISVAVNVLFSTSTDQLSATGAWLGAIFFGVQIYCDFAGYSDIAIGVSRLFGFQILENFDNPYLSINLGDFWRRWHISMSSWFRDYVYFPLARSKRLAGQAGKGWLGRIFVESRTSIFILIMFFLSGLWHGANWTFVFWGVLHGLGIVVERAIGIPAYMSRDDRRAKIIKPITRGITLLFVTLLWVPFRAPNIEAAISYWGRMIAFGGDLDISASILLRGLFWFGLFVVFQTGMLMKEKSFRSPRIPKIQEVEAWVYFFALLMIPSNPADFIYFQF